MPVAVVCLVILAAWYMAAIPMNWVVTSPKIAAAGGGALNVLAFSWNDARPVIPAPHQIAVELWNTVVVAKPWTVRSLVYHGWVTLSSTLLGFLLGTALGIGLAVAIVHSRLRFFTELQLAMMQNRISAVVRITKGSEMPSTPMW